MFYDKKQGTNSSSFNGKSTAAAIKRSATIVADSYEHVIKLKQSQKNV